MATTEDRSGAATHEVFNQAPPLENHNVFTSDRPLVEAVDREGGDWAADRIAELGAICGRPDTIRLGIEANENPPKLRRTTASATASTRSSSTPHGTS